MGKLVLDLLACRQAKLPVALLPDSPVVLKAQHEPHCSWFLTGVTAPLATQSTLAGTVALEYLKGLLSSLSLQQR